jgi:FAD/FMN-containing dehydrogenase
MAFKVNWKKEQKLATIAKEWTDERLNKIGVSHNQLKKLEMQLVGRIVLPGMPDYEASRQGKGLSDVQEYPKMIVYCATFNDAWLCLEWAHTYNFWVTCRSGGHSTANFSVNSGMVIDVSNLSYVVVDRNAMIATVGAGTQFHKFNTQLDTYKVHVPSGGCPDVAVGGYMMGGGYGFTSREYGIQSDCVESVTMMLADGNIVVASKTQNSDLYWAVRGGTGDNFGVLLEVNFQLFDLHEVWGFVLQWPIEHAADAYVALQNEYMKTGASPKLGYQLILTYIDGKRPVLGMAGMYHGTREEGKAAIENLMKVGNPTLSTDKVGTYNALNEALMEFLPGIPKVKKPVFEVKDGGYIEQPINRMGWQEIVDAFLKTPTPFNIAYCEVYGGAINTYPLQDSAFIHRNNFTDLYIDSFWSEDPNLPDKKPAEAWVEDFMTVLTPYLNGHKYQNYPKRQFKNFRWEFWGDAYNSLLFVKQKYDPTNFFNFEQSISPYPEDKDVRRSRVPSRFTDKKIIYEPYAKSFMKK